MSEARYDGVCLANDWCTRHASLNSTLRRTGSQCNFCRTGVICSHRRVPVVRRAGAFGADCIFCSCSVRSKRFLPLRKKCDFYDFYSLNDFFVFRFFKLFMSATNKSLLLWPPCVADAHIIFLPCGFYLLSSSFFPRLISAVADWVSPILAHIVWP